MTISGHHRARTCALLPLVVALSFGVLGVSCAESTTLGSDGGTGDGGAGDGGRQDAGLDAGRADGGRDGGGDAGRDAGPSPVCPASEPAASAPCSPDGLLCGYGSSLDTRCRVLAECSAGAFQLNTPPSACSAPTPASCAATPPATGTPCAGAVGDVCSYAASSTVCECVEFRCWGGCQLLDPPEWVCDGPPATPGCPAVAPNYGDACDEAGLECRYLGGGCQGGATLRCMDGYFQSVLEICPL